MAATAKIEKSVSKDVVSVMLTGGRVTVGFRTSLFAAAGREGVSVNEYVLLAAAEKLRAAGAPFDGVFSTGDLISETGPDPFAGSDRRAALEIGAGFVREAEFEAFQAAKPKGATNFEWAIRLFRQAVLSRRS